MTAQHATDALTAAGHARAMAGYIRDGEGRAMALGNRGPIKLDGDGNLDAAILEAYWRTGFYVLEGVINGAELAELRADVARVLAGAPVSSDADCDKGGKQAIGHDFALAPYGWARPLSDPLGGTAKNKGRHPVKMLDPAVPEGAPEWTIERLRGNLQLMDSCLHLYGHPGLLAVVEAVLGPNFVPYNEVVFIKEPGLGPSVAWHQDGITHWDAADWDHGAHGFNFMAQLHPSTAGNGVWVLPGSHKLGKMDIRQLVADSGSERIEGAVPLLCGAGDVFICNRQLVHGSFANSSLDRRITLNAGFFPRPGSRCHHLETGRHGGHVYGGKNLRTLPHHRPGRGSPSATFSRGAAIHLPAAGRPGRRQPLERTNPRNLDQRSQSSRLLYLKHELRRHGTTSQGWWRRHS